MNRKVRKVTNALARNLSNIGGPNQSRRKVLSNVVNSILLYAASIWSTAAAETWTLSTMSFDAVCVISGIMPIQLVAEEQIHRLRCKNEHIHLRTATREARTVTTERWWQLLWNTNTKGQWTHRLILHVELCQLENRESWITVPHTYWQDLAVLGPINLGTGWRTVRPVLPIN